MRGCVKLSSRPTGSMWLTSEPAPPPDIARSATRLATLDAACARSQRRCALSWAERTSPLEGPWFVVALEVLDNLPHDKLRLQPAGHGPGSTLLEAVASPLEPQGDGPHATRWREEFRPLADPDLRRAAQILGLDTPAALNALHDAMTARPAADGSRSLSVASQVRRS